MADQYSANGSPAYYQVEGEAGVALRDQYFTLDGGAPFYSVIGSSAAFGDIASFAQSPIAFAVRGEFLAAGRKTGQAPAVFAATAAFLAAGRKTGQSSIAFAATAAFVVAGIKSYAEVAVAFAASAAFVAAGRKTAQSSVAFAATAAFVIVGQKIEVFEQRPVGDAPVGDTPLGG